jgi:hypothetical protein
MGAAVAAAANDALAKRGERDTKTRSGRWGRTGEKAPLSCAAESRAQAKQKTENLLVSGMLQEEV